MNNAISPPNSAVSSMRRVGGEVRGHCPDACSAVHALPRLGLTDLRNSLSPVPSVLSKQTGLYIVGAKNVHFAVGLQLRESLCG